MQHVVTLISPQSLVDASRLAAEPELKISITADKTNGILTIEDTGIGMTKADLINNLGTSASAASPIFLAFFHLRVVCFCSRQVRHEGVHGGPAGGR